MTNNNPLHTGDAQMSDMEKEMMIKKELLEIVSNPSNQLRFADITFGWNGYLKGVGKFRALIGFNDQRDVERFAELTNGEFHEFYKKDEWQLMASRGRTSTRSIYSLGRNNTIYYMTGNETTDELSLMIIGCSIYTIIEEKLKEHYDDKTTGEVINAIKGNNVNYENLHMEIFEEAMQMAMDVIGEFEFSYKGKGFCEVNENAGYTVNCYTTEYPAHYKRDNKHIIYGVLYKAEQEPDIIKIINNK